MYDKELVVDILKKLDIAIDVIVKRTESIHEPNDFLTSWMGTLILDGVCNKNGRPASKRSIPESKILTSRT